MPAIPPIRIDPFHRIVNVSWFSIKYYTYSVPDNSSSAPVTGDTWIAEDTDVDGLISTGLFGIPSTSMPFVTPAGTFSAFGQSDHRVALSNLTTPAGRRDAVDHAHDYYIPWYVRRRSTIVLGTPFVSGTFANVFCLGRYILDHLHQDSFHITQADLGVDVTFNRPIDKHELESKGAVNWGIVNDDMDHIMDPEHF